MSSFEIVPLGGDYRNYVNTQITDSWNGPFVVARGVLHDTRNHSGFVAISEGIFAGYILYNFDENACEITVLETLINGAGIGAALIKEVLRTAREQCCQRVWLITTNDNMQAIRFYQRFGFELVEVFINAMDSARKLKPQIPLTGDDDIPIKHEFEFEIALINTGDLL